MHLLHLFDLSLVNRRDDVALEWGGETFTFADVERRSNRVANALRARGFVKGDRLCVYLANRIELIDIYLACVKFGDIVGELDDAALREACRASLASFKVPRRFVRVDSIPRTALGKVQKHLLAK